MKRFLTSLVEGVKKAWTGPARSAQPRGARPSVESLEAREVPALVGASSLVREGLSFPLAAAIAQAYEQAAHAPWILDPRPVAPQVRLAALARLNAGHNNLNYFRNPSGFGTDLRTAFGYGPLNNLTATGGTAAAIYNDPWIASQSGQLADNATLNYITDYLSRNATNVNAVGVLNSGGLGHTALAGAIGQAQAVGAFGSARPAGTGSGSPFIDSFGPPVGTRPQDRMTYPGYATISPFVSGLGAPVGYNSQLGSPLLYAN
jgi:hypothetical protein